MVEIVASVGLLLVWVFKLLECDPASVRYTGRVCIKVSVSTFVYYVETLAESFCKTFQQWICNSNWFSFTTCLLLVVVLVMAAAERKSEQKCCEDRSTSKPMVWC